MAPWGRIALDVEQLRIAQATEFVRRFPEQNEHRGGPRRRRLRLLPRLGPEEAPVADRGEPALPGRLSDVPDQERARLQGAHLASGRQPPRTQDRAEAGAVGRSTRSGTCPT
jgi:hypothetical protein